MLQCHMQPFTFCGCARLMVSISRCLDMPFSKGTYRHINFYSEFSFFCIFPFPHLYAFEMHCCVIYLPNVFVSLHPNSVTCILNNHKIWRMDIHCIWLLGVQQRARILLGLLKEIHMLMVSHTVVFVTTGNMIYPEPPSVSVYASMICCLLDALFRIAIIGKLNRLCCFSLRAAKIC